MTISTHRAVVRRPSTASRRFGYLVAVVITVVGWFLINVRPGWEALPFLTPATTEVLRLLNLSLAVSVAVNLLYVVRDPRWLRALGDLATTVIGLAVLMRVWQVFPFDFSAYSFGWAGLTRAVLVLAMVGSSIAVVVQLVTLIRLAGASSRSPD